MMYASWDTEYNQSNFLSFWAIFYRFTPLLTPKIKSWKNLNKTWRYKILLHIYHKQRSWCMVPEIQGMTKFFAILGLWPSKQTEKAKFWKNEKNTWRYYHFTLAYQKWQSSNNVWFLRYGTWQTDFFVILDYFLPFYPTNNPENQDFEKWTKCLEISSFYTSAPKIMITCYTVP